MVGISLREAEREVLSWFDPTQRPRVLWSRYLRREDLVPFSVLGHRSKTEMVRWVYDYWGTAFEERVLDETVAPFLIAVAATGGSLGRPGKPAQLPPGPTGGVPDRPASPPELNLVVGLFEADTGERLAAVSLSDHDLWPGGRAESLAAAPPLLATYSPSARIVPSLTPTAGPRPTYDGPTYPPPTPSITPTPQPPRVQLTLANLPLSLRQTFRSYPLAPGSSWTWRIGAVNGNVRWARQVVTETVVAAWREGDHAVVESDMTVQDLTPGNVGPERLGARAGRHTRYVLSKAILGDLSYGTYPIQSLPGSENHPSPFTSGGVAVEALVMPFSAFEATGPTTLGDGTKTVTTAAGTFDGCTDLSVLGGNGWGAGRTFCPGVGYVLHSFTAGSSWYGNSLDAELVRWHRAALPDK